MEEADILARVREAVRQKVLFLPHAIRQLSHPDRMITPSEVERVLLEGEVIEDYPTAHEGIAVCCWVSATMTTLSMSSALQRTSTWQ